MTKTTSRVSLATVLLMVCGYLAVALVAESATAAPRYHLNMTISDTTPAVGQAVSFTGRVQPPAPGKRVRLQGKANGSGWVTLKRMRLTKGSTYKTFLRFPAKGRIALRVVKPASRTIAKGVSPTRIVKVGVKDAPPVITTPTAPGGAVGVPYSWTVRTADGRPGHFSISAGSLPPGLSIDDQDGEISGTPTLPGTYDFTVRFIDPDFRSDTQDLTIVVVPPPAP